MRCVACNAGVEYGQDLCFVCKEVVMEYNKDLIDKQKDEVFIDEQGEEIMP